MNTRERMELRRRLWAEAKAGTLTLDEPEPASAPEPGPARLWWADADTDDDDVRTPSGPAALVDSLGPVGGGGDIKLQVSAFPNSPRTPDFSDVQLPERLARGFTKKGLLNDTQKSR